MKSGIAVKVENESEFYCVMSFIKSKGWTHQNGNDVESFVWDPPHPGNVIVLHDGFYIYNSDSDGFLITGYDVIFFYHFSLLTGVKVPEKPKEVILRWMGGFVNVVATVRKSHIYFEMNKNVVNLILNTTQINELLTAIKSLEDHE